jgi:hypothetical protein
VTSCSADVELVAAHTHSLSVSAAHVEQATERSYETSEVSGHVHEVTLTADDFAMLANGSTVEVESTEDDAHTHRVSIMCT